MKCARFFYPLLATLMLGLSASQGAELERPVPAAPVQSAPADSLSGHLLWQQIDLQTAKVHYQAQPALVASGVRGAEATDTVLAQLYYRGKNARRQGPVAETAKQ